jgi:hypothetical protein
MTAATKISAAVLVAYGVLTAAGVAPAGEITAPTPVLERTLNTRDRVVRTSLFSNGVLVVSVRRGGERVLFQQLTLPSDQFSAYLTAIQRDASELAVADELPTADGSGGLGIVTIHIAPGGPIQFSYSSLTVYGLAATRLIAILDDLEQQVLNTLPEGPGIADWQPRIGDVVRLRGGPLAEVVEVRDDGTVLLEHRETYINELVPAVEIRNVVIELVKTTAPK